MDLADIKVGNTYNFNTKSPQFIGSRITKAKLIAVTDTEGARNYAPVAQLYAQVYPSLPPGTVKDLPGRIWYIFRLQNGSNSVICDQWVVENSVELVQTVTYRIFIAEASLGQADAIKQALAGIGISNVNITTE